MSKKTALTELVEWLNKQESKAGDDFTYRCIQRSITKATELLSKEREDIENSYVEGCNEGLAFNGGRLIITAKDYFNNTFNQLP